MTEEERRQVEQIFILVEEGGWSPGNPHQEHTICLSCGDSGPTTEDSEVCPVCEPEPQGQPEDGHGPRRM